MTMIIDGLTSRHFEIARLLWEGYTRKAIRTKLGLGETSVRNEINQISDILELDRSKDIDAQIIRWWGEQSQGGPTVAEGLPLSRFLAASDGVSPARPRKESRRARGW